MAPEEILTPRLRLRRWRDADEEPMAAINRDPEVTRWLNRPVDDGSVRAFLSQMRRHWDDHGIGPWAVELREDGREGELVGFVGLAYPAFLPELAHRAELGWRLARSAWGRGLATEGALAARADAFGARGLGEVISIIHPENERSRRVATKLGMRIEGRVHNPVLGREVDVWQQGAPG